MQLTLDCGTTVLMVVVCGDCVISDDSTLVPCDTSDLVWMSGVEARMQTGCSLTECITSALDCLKGTSLLI